MRINNRKNNLSEKERHILAAVELQANIPIKQLQKRTGYQSHTIRYALNKLEQAGVIRPLTFIDAYPLGYTDYAFYFSLSTNTQAGQQKIIEHLIASPHVSWLGGLGGEYQFGAAVYVRSIAELNNFMDGLSKTFGNVFFQKAVTLRSEFVRFPRVYLSKTIRSAVKNVSFGNSTPAQHDEIDQTILHELGNTSLSVNAIAKKTNIPAPTVYSRIEKLEENNIITGYTYAINSLAIGMHTYELLIHAKGLHHGFRDALYQFAQKHPNIVHFVRTVGQWDYELGVELSEASKVNDITRELYDTFSDDIHSITVLPLFEYHKESYYPM